MLKFEKVNGGSINFFLQKQLIQLSLRSLYYIN